MTTYANDNLCLISGKSATGKSLSLMNLEEPEGVVYLNCETGKKLPFKSKFDEKIVTDPYQIYGAFEHLQGDNNCHTIVIDSLTFMMDMFETLYINPVQDKRSAWGDYAQFFKFLMSQHVASSDKNVIFTGHTMDILNEKEMAMETLVKVKGSLMNQGIESFFSTVISTKKLPTSKLTSYESSMLNITDQEEALGYKYCFQTILTKETVNERIRSPLGMWDVKETFIDNDMQQVLNKLHSYYS